MTVFKEPLSHHLTAGPNDGLAHSTWPGQAHWGGSGPQNMTCRHCEHWAHGNNYHSKRGRYGGLLKPARCRKFRALTLTDGDPVPDDAAACRHFSAATVVPDRFAKW
jgi:hypothetical protein